MRAGRCPGPGGAQRIAQIGLKICVLTNPVRRYLRWVAGVAAAYGSYRYPTPRSVRKCTGLFTSSSKSLRRRMT